VPPEPSSSSSLEPDAMQELSKRRKAIDKVLVASGKQGLMFTLRVVTKVLSNERGSLS
jgi:hypothetical protein